MLKAKDPSRETTLTRATIFGSTHIKIGEFGLRWC
jgi:hypothetical protein